MKTLQEQAEAMLETIDTTETDRKYERLTAGDRALIFQLHAKEVQQADIARIVGCHASTVSRALKLVDTRQGAQMMLQSKAADMAQHVIDKGDPDTHRKVLTQMDVLPKEGHGGGMQCNVIFGIQMNEERCRAVLPQMPSLPSGDDAA